LRNDSQSFRLKTEFKEGEFAVGADLHISNADARALLLMTDMNVLAKELNDQVGGEESMRVMAMRTRTFLRDLAKRILYTSGDTTEFPELIEKFTGVQDR
jgi:hypothetical protein